MTGSAILAMLFGGALVAIGVLAAALAERIRDIRAVPRAQRDVQTRPVVATAHRPIEVVESRPTPKAAPRDITQAIPIQTQDDAKDVIAALVAAGYKKPIATEATWNCNQSERATPETWTAAALRRCARGGLS